MYSIYSNIEYRYRGSIGTWQQHRHKLNVELKLFPNKNSKRKHSIYYLLQMKKGLHCNDCALCWINTYLWCKTCCCCVPHLSVAFCDISFFFFFKWPLTWTSPHTAVGKPMVFKHILYMCKLKKYNAEEQNVNIQCNEHNDNKNKIIFKIMYQNVKIKEWSSRLQTSSFLWYNWWNVHRWFEGMLSIWQDKHPPC